jgi:uncharacterized protein UPF0158
MRRVKVDLPELEIAFENASWQVSYYLDLDSGEVLHISDETRHMLDDLNEMYSGETDEAVNFDDIVARRELANWVKDELRTAHQIEQGYGVRFIQVPETDAHEGYQDMKGFIETVRDERLREQLWRVIQGQGAFRRFKDTLLDDPHERERWFAFKEAAVRQRITDWLEAEGIEAVTE